MVKVITFLKRIPEDHRSRIVGRAWGNFARRRHRLHTEVDRMRQSRCSESKIQAVLSHYRASANKPQLSLSKCRELGIQINDDVVINLGSRRDSK